jgi:cellulose biosynthesis protein BcsQ
MLMRILVTSIKGGVGKTSIASCLAAYLDLLLVTNDLIHSNGDDVKQIKPNTKRIPLVYSRVQNIVYDFGAMYSEMDKKIAHAAALCDFFVIPTLTDVLSLKAAIETYEMLKEANKPIIFIINNFTSEKKFNNAEQALLNRLGQVSIFGIRKTTLFERFAEHGGAWLESVQNGHGEYQLAKTKKVHNRVYDAIVRIGSGT